MLSKRSRNSVGNGSWKVGGESGKEIRQGASGRLRNLEMSPIRLILESGLRDLNSTQDRPTLSDIPGRPTCFSFWGLL